MTTYRFTLILNVPQLSEDDCDRIYEAGGDDATVVSRDGKTYVHFDRESESLEAAIRSATKQLQSVGLDIVRIEMDALV